MKYEVVKTESYDEWHVEAINYDGDGEVYVAIFSGPDAKARAEEYAQFKAEQAVPSMKFWKRFRSAITGRWVYRSDAEAHPAETVAETVPKKIVAEDIMRRELPKKG